MEAISVDFNMAVPDSDDEALNNGKPTKKLTLREQRKLAVNKLLDEDGDGSSDSSLNGESDDSFLKQARKRLPNLQKILEDDGDLDESFQTNLRVRTEPPKLNTNTFMIPKRHH